MKGAEGLVLRPGAILAAVMVAAGGIACSGAPDRQASDNAPPPSEVRQPLVGKIEHFYATAPDAERGRQMPTYQA